jgi:hypothetical protein
MRFVTTLGILGLTVGVALAASPARADEAKTLITASTILTIVAPPPMLESRSTAFDRSLREDGPPPRRSITGEVQADGSVRYGRTTITVRNPCPPGDHFDPLPLPGRRGRN